MSMTNKRLIGATLGLAGLAMAAGVTLWHGADTTVGGPGGLGNASLVQPAQAAPPGPPVADAGLDRTVALDATVVLDGTGSTDPKERSLQSFTWTLLSVPVGSTAALDDATLIKPRFTVDLAGDYTVELVVAQGNRTSDPDTVVISTVNSAPVADAGADQAIELAQTVQLNGGGSFDVDGDAISYAWTLVSVPGGSGASISDPAEVLPTFFADTTGDYVAELVVDDGTGPSAAASVTFSTDNVAPVSDAGPDRAAAVGQTLTLEPGGTGDDDGDEATLDWTLIGMPVASSASLTGSKTARPTITIDAPGTYVVQLVVDDGPLDGIDTLTIDTGNIPPLADAGADQTAALSQVVQLDGAATSDVDGDALVYEWSLVAVPAGSAAVLDDAGAVRPSFTVDLDGTYVAQLVVRDGAEEGRPDSVVIDTVNSGPVADAGPDQTVAINDFVQLDAAGSDDADTDPLSYRWTMLEKPNGPGGVLDDPTIVDPTFQAKKAGDYLITLTVDDGFGPSAPDTVIITTDNSRPVADAGADQAVFRNDVVQLDAAASIDADNDTLGHFWALIRVADGSAATLSDPSAAAPTFTADASGTYVAQLIVVDGVLESRPATVVIVATNRVPVANAGPTRAC